jgi:hypothetical protein
MTWAGRKYDSLSGVGAVVGKNIKKIFMFGVKQKDCHRSTHYTNKKLPIPPHRCYRNHSGSSNSMEADLAGELLTGLENCENVQIENLVMDDDLTTVARLSRDLSTDINKISDVKQTVNGVTSALYKIQHKELSNDVIQYFL